jgi:hypothetical protein
LAYVVLLGTFVVSVSSCNKDDDDPANGSLGTITGTVLDENGQPISDVKVTVSGVNEDDLSATTGADGRYTIANVSQRLHAVTFSKKGWLTVSKSISAKDFDAGKSPAVDISMVSASAKITGTVTDAKNNNAPLADVTVTVGVAGTAKTTSDGTYTIEDLVAGSYTITFSKANYVSISRPIAKTDFVDDLAKMDIAMGGTELLRGLTADDLKTADKWWYNEYRGGGDAPNYPHWDWSCDYMATLDFRGAWQEQNEGTTLQIRNDPATDRTNPADLNVFDSFVFGSKAITADNKIMSLRIRTHNADATAPAFWGVQVIDLAAAEPATVKVGGDKSYGSGDYADIDFDLSAYIGKEVIIAIGIYRQATGDYYKQLVLQAIRFADKKVTGTGTWLPGTEISPGFGLTHETVRSTMPTAKTSFTGLIKNYTGAKDRDHRVDVFRDWRANDHVAATWSFVPFKKDPEIFPGEGYLIKTRGGNDVSTVVPDAYLYAKFAISGGNDQLTLKTRNFGGNYTFFKLTAIEDNGTVTQLAPANNTAQDASAAADGCWKFKHGAGDANHPDDYASFVYDLMPFSGRNVTLVFGVYKGEANGDENKLCFYSINLD